MESALFISICRDHSPDQRPRASTQDKSPPAAKHCGKYPHLNPCRLQSHFFLSLTPYLFQLIWPCGVKQKACMAGEESIIHDWTLTDEHILRNMDIMLFSSFIFVRLWLNMKLGFNEMSSNVNLPCMCFTKISRSRKHIVSSDSCVGSWLWTFAKKYYACWQ